MNKTISENVNGPVTLLRMTELTYELRMKTYFHTGGGGGAPI